MLLNYFEERILTDNNLYLEKLAITKAKSEEMELDVNPHWPKTPNSGNKYLQKIRRCINYSALFALFTSFFSFIFFIIISGGFAAATNHSAKLIYLFYPELFIFNLTISLSIRIIVALFITWLLLKRST